MIHSFWWLYWILAVLVVMALLSIAAALQEWLIWRSENAPLKPKPKFPPGYGYPSWLDWQRKSMERFRASWWKRPRHWFNWRFLK